MSRIPSVIALALSAVALSSLCVADDGAARLASPDEVLDGLKRFYQKTARPDGSFQPGVDPAYLGMSDSAYSDLAAVTYACTIHRTFGWRLPHEAKTIAFLKGRQKSNGDFVNVAGTVDPESAEGRTYNTTQGLVALRALGEKPTHDPLPVFEEILRQDYKSLPAYSTSFFPLAYLCYGKPIPKKADRSIRALMVQDDSGYLNNHIAATFHASHYYALVGEPTPKSEQMVSRILRDQKADGGWMLNMPSRDRHATFDAVFTLTHEGGGRAACRDAVERAARWTLSCRNDDGGFGHFPGSPSDADAVYFQVGTLVMAGFLKPADPLPKDPHLLSWGHLMPVRERTYGRRRIAIPTSAWIGGVALRSDGRALATASSDGKARLWDVATGRMTAELSGHSDAVVGVAFSPDGQRIATASHDGTARLWSAAGEAARTLSGHRGAVTSVAFSPSGALLATGGIDATVRLWNATTGEPVRTLAGHRSWVNGVAFFPNGATLVSGSSDGTVTLWSVESGEPERTLTATKAEVRSVAVSPDGRQIAAGIRYGAIRTWSAEGADRLSFQGHESDVWSVTYSGDGRRLLSANGDWNRAGVVKTWNPSDGTLASEWKHTGEVLSVAASKEGGVVAAGGTDGTASIWTDGTRSASETPR